MSQVGQSRCALTTRPVRLHHGARHPHGRPRRHPVRRRPTDGVSALKAAWKPVALLATVGVLVTAAITGVAASYILELPLLTGMLLGSIVASTDAAAVFAVLRSQGVHLRERLAATLEIESLRNRSGR